MRLSDYETLQLQKIEQWIHTLDNEQVVLSDFVQIYDRWLEQIFASFPDAQKEQIFKSLDQILLYIQVFLQETERIQQMSEKILQQARIWNPDLQEIPDLKDLPLEKLQYLAGREINLHRMYSFMQGGLSGTGNTFLLTIDVPAIILVNLRAIQAIALSYGYPVQYPQELLTVLKIFHCATLPRRFHASGWQELMETVKKQKLNNYNFNERITDLRWVNTILLQVIKISLIRLFRNNEEKRPSLISLAIGAGSNYNLTKQVTEWADRFYQYRYLLEKKEAGE